MSLYEIKPPAGALTYRGWALWLDQGHYEHGIVYRETKWRGRSPDGDLIEHPSPAPGGPAQDGHAWLKAEIDRRLG